MQTGLLVLFATNSMLRTRASLAAAALSAIDAIGLCILSHLEHMYSIRPSFLINSYLILTLPFDIARSRTLWLEGATRAIAAVFSSTLAVKVMILITEAIGKRHILLSRYQDASPEATSGIYSRGFFWWLQSLMTAGFSRILTNEDLYPIDSDMASTTLNLKAQQAWEAANKKNPRALVWATLKASRAACAYCIFPRICLIGFKYAQPFLLNRTVTFAQNPDEPDSIGWGLTGAFVLTFLGLGIANGAYYHMVYRFITTVRGVLITLVYSKTMNLSITAMDESAAITLMANDSGKYCHDPLGEIQG